MKIQDFNPTNHHQHNSLHLARSPRIQTSRHWLVLHLFIVACALTGVILAEFLWEFKVLALVSFGPIAASLYQQYKRQSVFYLRPYQESWCFIHHRDPEQKYYLKSWCFRARFLLLLKLEDLQGKIHYFPVMKDSCSEEDFRCLVVVTSMNAN